MPEGEVLQDDVTAVLGLPSTSRILKAVCALTGVRFAAIARVTPERWITCASLDRLGFGLGPGDELDVNSTLCIEVRGCGRTIIVDDVATDPLYRDHWKLRQFGITSYISVPIADEEGEFFGTLCGLDTEMRPLNSPEVLETFALFADLIAAQLGTHRALATQGRELRRERSFGRVREEFLAMLGHDLRNPVSAIQAGARLLKRTPLDARSAAVVEQIDSSAARMEDLIRNLLDLARGRLGGGIPVEIDPEADIRNAFEEVVAETETASGRTIQAEFACGKLPCDPARMGQLLSNLLGNAVTHGTPDAPIHVRATERDSRFVVSVTNAGGPLPRKILRSLFQPFNRGQAGSSGEGLGLGLYIASEIAKAHGGELTAHSNDGTVTFAMTMPLPARPAISGAGLPGGGAAEKPPT
ncbi:GAF domain-containing sensor histidine kinase [Tranquillimonas alkanivorans]|uniref:histidine kinase n=1 Tax=Tranquillimonas alkanivorans TaxID=441119 RepID=A0A1I5U9X5_9RHOB|nr:GAF domain-containing sensor histidine kinase [Tranquillimonas alkanivorans]SFP91446.1 GAF sensor signal transduction histidine kinase [Tranquillimonas alkanivorans]